MAASAEKYFSFVRDTSPVIGYSYLRVEVSDHTKAIPERLLGKPFGERGLTLVREELAGGAGLCRAELARRVCVRLHWRSASGADQLMSARVGLLRLERAGWITLPAPRNPNGNGQPLARDRRVELPPRPVSLRADLMPGLFLQPVNQPDLSAIYNGLMEQWHYLGYTPMAGAQVRYLVGWPEGWLGALGFGASAWAVAARDQYLGWRPAQRQRRLHLILNNSRFLLAPWVRSANLASRVLGLCAQRLPADFRARYGYAPVLLETFVEEDRFAGVVYRAANWRCLGQTCGRGKKGPGHSARLPRKTVWVYPLRADFRAVLQGEAAA